MPKLNVQQNNQNIIQAFRNALAIGNLKGIIASDGNHNFSTAGSNRNLLDNPWFNSGNVINQRGATTIPVGGYGIDRWKGGSAGAVAVVSDGLQFNGAGNAYQVPPSGFWDNFIGKTMTASLLFSDGTVQGGSGLIGSGVTEFGTFNGVRIYKSASNNFNLQSTSDTNATVRAVKLELGSVSTLANDAPPDYGEELRKCQRYLRAIYAKDGGTYIGVGMGTSTNIYTIEFPFSMRATPTPSLSGTIDIYAPSGMHTVSSVAAQPSTTDTICINFTVNGTVSVYEMGHFNIYNNTRLLLSAEL